MKGILSIVCAIFTLSLFAQIPTYYNNVNLTLTGMALKAELSNKIIVTHTNELDYGWTALQQTDLDPINSNNVLLLYGYDDSDGSVINDRTRDKSLNGGNVGEWNREHTYAKSLANPSMTTDYPSAGTDAHHLRATDVQMNGNRGSRLFAAGSGNAGNVGSYWYPGDEWKGDVARMMMYMYLRYPSQCPPNDVGVGTAVVTDADMIELFLQWNADDTVSVYETNRNNILEGVQGNRNPFIDNPYLATIIWDGVVAQDKWNMTTTINENKMDDYFLIYPNPTKDVINLTIKDKNSLLFVYDVSGVLVQQYSALEMNQENIVIRDLSQGIYIFKFQNEENIITKKVVVN